ncbi:MAG: NADH-quinone oxidoreductase subunit N, partial [Thermoplasmata archaeon]
WLVLLPLIITTLFGFLLIALTFAVRRRRRLSDVALVGLLIALVLSLDMAGLGVLERIGLVLWQAPVSQQLPALMLEVTPFVSFFWVALLLTGVLIVLASRSFLEKGDRNIGEYYGLLLIALVGMLLVAASTDLFVLYLAFEMASLATFALAAFRKRDKRSTEAAMKFFIVGVVSSAIILFGISLIYGVSAHVAAQLPPQASAPAVTDLRFLGTSLPLGLAQFEPVVVLGLVLLIAGFGFKVATVPFHMWVPDVYDGAPTTVTTFLSTSSKIMGFAALFKIFLIALVGTAGQWALALGILAIATMTLGNVAALPQKSVKRMLAYSSIAHAGYVLIAVVVGSHSDPAIAAFGLAGGLYHLLVYVFMQGGAFIFVAMTATLLIGERLDDYSGLAKRMPLLAFAMMIMLLSLAGIPPLGGFVSKFILFWAAVQAGLVPGSEWMISLAVAGVLNSALSLFYYARVIKHMYILEGPTERVKVPAPYSVSLWVALIGTVATGVFAFFFIDFVTQAAALFFA